MIEQNVSSVPVDKPSTCSNMPSGHLVELLAVTFTPPTSCIRLMS